MELYRKKKSTLKQSEEISKVKIVEEILFKYLKVAAVLFFLVWYFMHPEYYVDDTGKTLFTNNRTYLISITGLLLMVMTIVPLHLPDKWNQIFGWTWFTVVPFAVYFSLLYMNAEKFHIEFWELNPIAVGFTFLFLFLLLTILMRVTGSIRAASCVLAVLVAALGIVNWYVVKFRGKALSAADLFSVGAAMTVVSGYQIEIDWHVFAEAFCTLAICIISCRIRRFKVLRAVPRLAVLCAWMVCTGSFFHVCCRTSFLEDHDIRSGGFTHQLRYKQFDMLFTTLCTCFYLAAEKPEGYSVDKVHEIGEAYVAQGSKNASAGKDAKRAAEEERLQASGSTVSADTGTGAEIIRKIQGMAGNGEDFRLYDPLKLNLSWKLFPELMMGRVSAEEEDGAEDAENAEPDVTEEKAEDGEVTEAADAGEEKAADGGAAENVESAASETDASTTSADQDTAPETFIVIMNESFADYENIGNGLDLSEDCMPFIHGLTENTIKGDVYVSIFGANTPNSEYEFLTGNTMGFLPPTSVGFNLFVRGNMPSVASELKTAGYKTLAIHPYLGSNYRRNIVYPQIGFDTFYTRDDFSRPQYIRRYISDWELSERIIREYNVAKRENTPLFCYNVTVQNHGDYLASNKKGVPDDIKVLDSDVDKTRTSIYVNLIKKSDEMFEKLVNYFSEEDERVAILMYGDHQANLGDDTYLHLLGKAEDELTPEELMEKYKIPFILWTNYDIPEETIEKTSMNYLYSIVADRLSLPMTGYQQYLLDLSEEIPVLAAGGYWTADGEFYELDDEASPYFERINDYNILEYNYIFGKDNRYLDLFELQE